jgi:hypothetical protein
MMPLMPIPVFGYFADFHSAAFHADASYADAAVCFRCPALMPPSYAVFRCPPDYFHFDAEPPAFGFRRIFSSLMLSLFSAMITLISLSIIFIFADADAADASPIIYFRPLSLADASSADYR